MNKGRKREDGPLRSSGGVDKPAEAGWSGKSGVVCGGGSDGDGSRD